MIERLSETPQKAHVARGFHATPRWALVVFALGQVAVAVSWVGLDILGRGGGFVPAWCGYVWLGITPIVVWLEARRGIAFDGNDLVVIGYHAAKRVALGDVVAVDWRSGGKPMVLTLGDGSTVSLPGTTRLNSATVALHERIISRVSV